MRQLLGLVLIALIGFAPLVRGGGGGGLSASEFNRYRSEQALGLKREQALRAAPSAARSAAEAGRAQPRLGAAHFRQRLLLDRQRRWVASERAKRRPLSSPLSSRGKSFQRLRREEQGERFSRKLSR